jgi:hypothetical protein
LSIGVKKAFESQIGRRQRPKPSHRKEETSKSEKIKELFFLCAISDKFFYFVLKTSFDRQRDNFIFFKGKVFTWCFFAAFFGPNFA